jgi:hypothetical protein
MRRRAFIAALGGAAGLDDLDRGLVDVELRRNSGRRPFEHQAPIAKVGGVPPNRGWGLNRGDGPGDRDAVVR